MDICTCYFSLSKNEMETCTECIIKNYVPQDVTSMEPIKLPDGGKDKCVVCLGEVEKNWGKKHLVDISYPDICKICYYIVEGLRKNNE